MTTIRDEIAEAFLECFRLPTLTVKEAESIIDDALGHITSNYDIYPKGQVGQLLALQHQNPRLAGSGYEYQCGFLQALEGFREALSPFIEPQEKR